MSNPWPSTWNIVCSQTKHYIINKFIKFNKLYSNFMEYIFQLTLKKIQFLNDQKDPKVGISLKIGQNQKKIPSPRMIRNKIANFYGQRLQLNCKNEQVANIIIYTIYRSNEIEVGRFKIDYNFLLKPLNKVKQDKYKLQNLLIEYEAKIYIKSDRDSDILDQGSQASFLSQKQYGQQPKLDKFKPPLSVKVKRNGRDNEQQIKLFKNDSKKYDIDELNTIQDYSIKKLQALQNLNQKSQLKKRLTYSQEKRQLKRRNQKSEDEDQKYGIVRKHSYELKEKKQDKVISKSDIGNQIRQNMRWGGRRRQSNDEKGITRTQNMIDKESKKLIGGTQKMLQKKKKQDNRSKIDGLKSKMAKQYKNLKKQIIIMWLIGIISIFIGYFVNKMVNKYII